MPLLASKAHQFGRVGKATGWTDDRCLTARGVAAQTEHVLNTACLETIKNALDFVPIMADTGEMRHRFESIIALDSGDKFNRLVTGAASRPVGDRDKVRMKSTQSQDSFHQSLFTRFALRGEELKREHRIIGRE